ncbi:MAG: hypothetical protein AMS17_14995, partial [Spirochaetes bacterium DG_61]
MKGDETLLLQDFKPRTLLIHTSDPAGFFEHIDRYNEHYPTLDRAPDWSFYGAHFSKKELLD